MAFESILSASLTFLLGALISGGFVYFKTTVQLGNQVLNLKGQLELAISELRGELKSYCVDRSNDEKRIEKLERMVFDDHERLNKLLSEHNAIQEQNKS